MTTSVILTFCATVQSQGKMTGTGKNFYFKHCWTDFLYLLTTDWTCQVCPMHLLENIHYKHVHICQVVTCIFYVLDYQNVCNWRRHGDFFVKLGQISDCVLVSLFQTLCIYLFHTDLTDFSIVLHFVEELIKRDCQLPIYEIALYRTSTKRLFHSFCLFCYWNLNQ